MLNKLKVLFVLASVVTFSSAVFASGDVVSGVVTGVKGIYHHALKPIPGWISKSAKKAKEGTIFVAAELGKDGKAVGTAFYTAGGKVMTDVVDPVAKAAVKTAVAAVQIPTYDMAWNMVLVPVGKGLKAGASADVLSGLQATTKSAAKGTTDLGSDLQADGQTISKSTVQVYEATAVPMYKGTKAAGAAIYHGTIKVLCGDEGCSGM